MVTSDLYKKKTFISTCCQGHVHPSLAVATNLQIVNADFVYEYLVTRIAVVVEHP